MSLTSIFDFLVLAAIWGASFLFTRIAVVEFGPLPTAAMRVLVAVLFLLPLVWWRGLAPEFRRHWKKIAVVGMVNSGIPFALYSVALLSITTGLSAILNATVPLFGAVVAWAWLGDRLTGSRVLGLVLGFAGVAMLAWDKAGFRPEATGTAAMLAIGACLLATLCYGIAASASKRYLSGIPPLVTAAGSQFGATLGLALPAALLWPAQMPRFDAWMAVVLVGIFCTGIAYILYFRLIEQAGPSRAIAVTFLVPVFALGYGAVFLGEPVTAWMLTCGTVIVLGTALSTGLVKLPARARL